MQQQLKFRSAVLGWAEPSASPVSQASGLNLDEMNPPNHPSNDGQPSAPNLSPAAQNDQTRTEQNMFPVVPLPSLQPLTRSTAAAAATTKVQY